MKGRRKTLFADIVVLCIENPKKSTQKLLELIHELSKVAVFLYDTQKPTVFLYISHEQSENKFKRTVPFTIASKRIKCIEIKWTEEVKDLYIDNN